MRYLSKVVKVGLVEEFKFEFQDKDILGNDLPALKKISDVEAILINPRWADHGFDPLTQTIQPQLSERRKAFAGTTLDEFKKLIIPDSVMREGILFVWVEKELMFEIILHFEKQGFSYVENVCHVLLDKKQRESTKRMNNTDATPALAREPYNFLSKAHRTLLMMRRT